jgi:hypothetical protein
MDNLKKKFHHIFGIGLLVILSIFTFFGCKDKDNSTDEPINPTIITAPKASNIIVGETTRKSILDGEFNVTGTLVWASDEIIATSVGTIEGKWEFIPFDKIKYKKLVGIIEIKVFNYRLSFEENCGFSLDDIYFNSTYTIGKKPITAKNNYRFRDWTLNDQEEDRITYPFVASNTLTLYAIFDFHSFDKVEYINFGLDLPAIGICAIANWGKYGVIKNPYLDFQSGPVYGSISGEVIIADMYNDLPVISVRDFHHTNITNILFPNYLKVIDTNTFLQCRSLGPELTIPNTVEYLGESAFRSCWSLYKVTFEEGDGLIDIKRGISLFYSSGLQDIVLNRIDQIPEWAFGYCNLTIITISHEIEEINRNAFYGSGLSEIIIEGNNLKYIRENAFGALSITSISIPTITVISPDAFFYCRNLTYINIADDQIEGIAKELHSAYIGSADDFNVEITRDSNFGGMKYEAKYITNTETITLKFEFFSIFTLDALIHEFFHHYQDVLSYGVGNENFYSVYICVENYSHYFIWFQNPFYIVANDHVLYDANHPEYGYRYEEYIRRADFPGYSYVLIDQNKIYLWTHDYIALLPNESNKIQWWNQPYEKDARTFATMFSGIYW